MDLFLDVFDLNANPLLYHVSFALCVISAVLTVVNIRRSYELKMFNPERQGDEAPPEPGDACRWDYERIRSLIRGDDSDADEPVRLPAMLVDTDALNGNIDYVTKVAYLSGTSLRIATKSVRCVEILRHIVERVGSAVCGFMCFSVEEAAFLSDEGFDDFLIPYPTVQQPDVESAVLLTVVGKKITLTVDCVEHVEIMDSLTAKICKKLEVTDPILRVAIDLDMSYKVRGFKIGAHRSRVDSVEKFKELVKVISDSNHLSLVGVIGYEASVAGLPDNNPYSKIPGFLVRLLKRYFFEHCRKFRAEISAYCDKADDVHLEFFNGGGSGNIEEACNDASLTEVAVGSAFLQGHLFDYYAANRCRPTICLALQVTRACSDYVCAQSGGFVASGACSNDKFPRPLFNPVTLSHYLDEGYGEVQTPLKITGNPQCHKHSVRLGDPVLFRPAKSGEIAEHFNHYHLLQKFKIIKKCRTYRGQGQAFH